MLYITTSEYWFKCKTMQSKILKTFFLGLFLLIFGCRMGYWADETSNPPDHRIVNYPSKSALKFPEEQIIKEQFEVTTKWQTISFEKPLKINRDGLMGFHLVVDQEPYISTMDEHPLNPECNEAGCEINAFCLRRFSAGTIVRPEVVLIGDNGEEVKVQPDGHLNPYSDKSIMTIALRTFKDVNSPPTISEGNNSLQSHAYA